jgi:hypothetical protein
MDADRRRHIDEHAGDRLMRRRLATAALTAVVVTGLLFSLSGSVWAAAASSAERNFSQDLVSSGRDLDLGPHDTVGRDVVCFGCNVNINGARVGRDVVAFGGNVSVRDGNIGRDVFAGGGNVGLHGHTVVGRDATTGGGDLSIQDQSSVGRNASAFGGDVSTGPQAHVAAVMSDGGARLPWEHGGSFFPHGLASIPTPGFLYFWTFGSLVPAFGFVLLSVLLLVIFPRQVAATGQLAQRQPVASFGLGCLGVVVAVALAVLFALTLILIPVSLVLLLAVAAAWVLGWTAILLVTGRRIVAAVRPQGSDPLPALLIGGLVLSVLWIVPLVNVLVGLIGGFVAVGAAVGSRFGTRTPGDRLFGGPPVVAPSTPPPIVPPPAGPHLPQPPP